MKSKLQLIIVLMSVLVTSTRATNEFESESEVDFDETASKYLSAVDNVNLLTGNETSEMVFSKCDFEKDDFKKIITSITRAMDFFSLHLDKTVLDSAIGTRLIQSQLKLVRDGHPRLPSALQSYLTNLQLQSELLSELIIESVRDNNQFSKQSKQEQLPWVLNSSLWEQPKIGQWQELGILEHDKLNGSSFKQFDRTVEVLTEEISDKCTAELFDGCKVTENCTKIFAQKPHSAYSLTHQVLFFLIAEKQNCFENQIFKNKIQGHSPIKFLEDLCRNVLLEANFIEYSGYEFNYRDLLGEQITVCAVAGYSNFLKRNWLNEILSWQNKDSIGCFAFDAEEEKDEQEDESFIDEEDEEEILARAGLTADDATKNLRQRLGSNGGSKRNRVKRSDEFVKIANKNCSFHFTAVSIGALSMYLRYFTDTCLSHY